MDERRLPFLEHLRELRTRIIRCLIAVVVGFIAAWFIHYDIFDWLMAPYEAAVQAMPTPFHQAALSRLPESGIGLEPSHTALLSYTGLVEPFFVYLKASLLGGLLVAIPVVFWQIWAFIAPGLYPKERRLAAPFVIGTTGFFLLGAGFCRYVVLEPACGVLLSIGATNTEPVIMMQDYFSFTSRFLLVFGAVFELPIIVAFLSWLGFVTHKTLIKYWRIALVLTFVIGAMLTPPDPFTQVALAAPLVVLYIISIGVAYMFSLRRAKKMEELHSEVEAA